MSFVLHRIKKRVVSAAGRIVRTTAFVLAVLSGGLGSSCYMMDRGSALTTEAAGPWITWPATGRPDADPYTRAHFARLGALLLSTEVASLYIATADKSGSQLHSSCDYQVEGRDLASHWWSLTVYDADGHIIPNAAERYGFTSDTIAMRPDSSYTVTLSRDAQPENWLPTGGAGQLALAFQAIDLGVLAVARDVNPVAANLPSIQRSRCR
jgi:hypothetical protein